MRNKGDFKPAGAFTAAKSHPRFHLLAPRWQIVLAALLALAGGMALWLAATADTERTMFPAYVVIMSTLLSLFSSLRSGQHEGLDERETRIRDSAIAGGASSVVILTAVYLLFASTLDALWLPLERFQFGAVGLVMLAATLQLAIIFAALRTPSYAADLESELD